MRAIIEFNGQQISVDPEQRILIFDDHGTKSALMYMPGYNDLVMIAVEKNEGPAWHWNGNVDKPNFSPSILTRTVRGVERKKVRNHVFVRDGTIQFLSDCTHELAGKTVELPKLCEWPEEVSLWD